MRKFLFILILLPAITALGHDAYMFTKAPEKGFRISDIGSLWDRYHKESHDKWKTKLNKFSKSIEDLNISKQKTETPQIKEQSPNDANDYSGSFIQTDKQGNNQVIPAPIKKQAFTKPSKIQKTVGFILEQKALFFFSAIALIIYLINSLLKIIFREKTGMENLRRLHKKEKKGEGYKYGRK